MTDFFIGLMSGTSLDGIDAALVAFDGDQPELVATHYHPYEPELRARLRNVCYADSVRFRELGELDAQLGELFAATVRHLLQNSGFEATRIGAIGCHGQTVFHHPFGPLPFSLQIGDPNRIAALTGIPAIADFRRKDLALGGQGAPLAPAFHRAVLARAGENRVVVNIGGIANLTVLPGAPDRPVYGFDSGPGNTFLDLWVNRHVGVAMDRGGEWGSSGALDRTLLGRLLDDPYFRMAPPKSTGQEYFSPSWLDARVQGSEARPEDIQHTLAHFTAQSIAAAVQSHAEQTECVLVCGGGAHNDFLMSLLRTLLACEVLTTAAEGIHPDWVEAMTFAWLARQTQLGRPGNLASVTGAAREAILGAIYPP